MRRACRTLIFPSSFTLPGEIIELRHVLLCHLLKQITTILVTKTMVSKNKMMFHKNEMSFYLL